MSSARVRLTTMEVRQLRETRSHSQRQRAADDGMTIVELLVALFIVALAFTVLASTLMSSFGAIRNNEARVVATALGNELIEEMSSIPWALLGLYEDDVSALGFPADEFEGDLLVQIPAPAAPSDRHPAVPEPVSDPPIDRDGREYTVKRYITWHEEDVGPNLKRMIVIITWEVGGSEQTIRTEGLRSPDPDDLVNLKVSFESLANVDTGEDRVALNAPDPSDPDQLKNADAFKAVIRVGVIDATAQLRFRDRDNNLRTLTTPSIPGGDDHLREFLISENAYRFPHGNVTFTVIATGDGEVASHAEVLRFYQPVDVQALRFTQDGEPVSEVTVCDGELQGDLIVDAEVWGLTPAEGAIDGTLALEWGRQPGSGQPVQDRQPDPPVVMIHTAATDDGGDFRAEIDDGTPLMTSTGAVANAFRLTANRRLGEFDAETGAYQPHHLDQSDFARAVVIVQGDDCP